MRTGLVLFTTNALARALVIAVRYSVVRRQGEIEPGYFNPFLATQRYCINPFRAGEVQVMDYQTQQFKLLPLLASAYALSSTGVAMMMMFMQVRGQIEEGNLESLPEVRQLALPLTPEKTESPVIRVESSHHSSPPLSLSLPLILFVSLCPLPSAPCH